MKLLLIYKLSNRAYNNMLYIIIIYNIAQNQSFVQKEIGVKYIDYNYSPTQSFQYFQAFGFNVFTYYLYNLILITL